MSAPNGYRVCCTICGRVQMSGASPLANGWPKCCGYTMRLADTEAFIRDIPTTISETFGHKATCPRA